MVAGAVNLLNPSLLVVGDDMAGTSETFAAGLRGSVYRTAPRATDGLSVAAAAHGDGSGLAGCAAQVTESALGADAVELMPATRNGLSASPT